MQWHQSNQAVIAENIAHANTPDYKARQLSEPDFEAILLRERQNGYGPSTLKRTNAAHLQVSLEQVDVGQAEEVADWEVTPSGNSVVLEEQMMKLAENQLNYQTVTSLYSKSLKLMKIAVGN
ncbi:MAG: flagellar basal body rod protein FlgB [Alphaproteobacteria bacterium]|nr:flagellar basal body rod protein FlgB [Alphaproteobacteria bacterium]